jgi:hypothetical protein
MKKYVIIILHIDCCVNYYSAKFGFQIQHVELEIKRTKLNWLYIAV